MKKYLTISAMAILGLGAVVSCTTDREIVHEVPAPVDYPQVYDLKGVNFTPANSFTYIQGFNAPLLDQDFVLIYRKKGNLNNGKPIWEPIPKTIYLDNGEEIDYDYDYSVVDFSISLQGTYDVTTTPEFSQNQTFRVILVPAEFGKGANSNLSKMSYDEVIQRYKIDDSKPVSLK